MIDVRRTEGDVQLRKYLLGDIHLKEQAAVEERLLTDAQSFNDLLRVEEELTDDYVAGKLGFRERQLFEAHFLTNFERRNAVDFAKALRRYGAAHPPQLASPRHSTIAALPPFGYWRPASAIAAVIVIVALAGALLLLSRQAATLRDQYSALQEEHKQDASQRAALSQQLDQQRQKNNQLSNELAQQNVTREHKQRSKTIPTIVAQESLSTIVTLTLAPGRSRALEQPATAHLGSTTKNLRLLLQTDAGKYERYRVEVQTANGDSVWKGDAQATGGTKTGRTVVVSLPLSTLTMRDYLVLLVGVTPGGTSEYLGSYDFRVARE